MIFGVVCAAVLGWRLFLVAAFHVSALRTYIATDTRLDALLFGAIAALCWNRAELKALERHGFSLGLLAFSVVMMIASAVLNAPFIRETVRYTLQAIALLPFLYLVVSHGDHVVCRWLEWRPMRYTGQISFTLYLVKYIMIFMVIHMISSVNLWDRAAVTLVLSIVYATGMRYAVKRPIQHRRRTVVFRPNPSVIPAKAGIQAVPQTSCV